MNATPRIKVTKKKFGQMLMKKHDGQVEQSQYSEETFDGNPPARMTLYYSPSGHCATWMRGEGWEFVEKDAAQ